MASALEMLRGLWDYHWWANRRLLDAAAALGEEAARREVGRQFSFPTLKGMLAHIYGADRIWLERWRGGAPTHIPGDGDFATLADLRRAWDALEAEQRRFIDGLGPADAGAVLGYRGTGGEPWTAPLWRLLQHVPNHATHHRSEIATMLTMTSGPPPATDLIVHQRIVSGQLPG